MIRVNLLPIREEARQRDLKQQLMLLVLVLIAQVLGLSMWYASTSDTLRGVEMELAREKRETAELQKAAGALEKLREAEKKLLAKAEVVEIVGKLNTEPAKAMMQIALNIPNRLWLTGVAYYPIRQPLGLREPILRGGERITPDMLPIISEPIFALGITGFAMGPNDVTDFAKNLKGTKYFDHIEFGEVKEVLYKEAEVPVQQFELYARVAGWQRSDGDSKKKKGRK